jgi:hypothetical protein
VFALIEDIWKSGQSVAAYARARGLKGSTLTSRVRRAGIQLSIELRRRRVQHVHDLKAEHPEWTWTRAAVDGGFPTLSSFHRTRRLLLAHGLTFEAPAVLTPEELVGRVLSQARRLAEVADNVLRERSFLGLRVALSEFREAEHLLERALVRVGVLGDAH